MFEKKINFSPYQKPSSIPPSNNGQYYSALDQNDDEKLLLRTIIKIKKNSKFEPPLDLNSRLLNLLSHHNINILLSCLQILTFNTIYTEINAEIIFPFINHEDFRRHWSTTAIILN
eukprot:NODE_347_length_9026_cov_0.640641.p8 type:complete len:116 gc:universal NODE_347_length_9026_cov_0.640641:388-41(-)